MASYTPNLDLLKKDPVADAGDTFNIKTMMNDNWDKIDGGFGALQTEVNGHLAELVTDAEGAHGLKVESGNFTPVLLGETITGNPTYTTQSGEYYKIGNLVYVNINITISNKGGLLGNVSVSGLPFFSKGANKSFSLSHIAGIIFGDKKQLIFTTNYESDRGTFYFLSDGGYWTTLQDTEVTNNAEINLTGTYITN
ncbi:hypothetical protein MKY04_16180 [Lysinibacillus telephonicus]|uniref:hypothetical protein n=1 Tax=Lysinibacillus telephonicus TaxID=1714840 RepID=UPI0031FDE8F9